MKSPRRTSTGMDGSLREHIEASLATQMDASLASHDEGISTRRYSTGGVNAGGGFPALTRTSSRDHSEFTREQLLEQIVNPRIEDDSPAAAALRANAQVHIGKMGKVARSINAQAIRKVVKRASMRSHFGNVKGKPPRVPPSQMNNQELEATIYGIEEGEFESELDLGASGSSMPSLEDQLPDLDSPKSRDSEASAPPPLAKFKESEEAKEEEPQVMITAAPASPTKKPESPKKVDVVVKEAPKNLPKLPGDHVHFSLQAMKNQQPSVHALAPEGNQKDIPREVVEGTMEAGRKVMKSVDPHDLLKLTRWKRKKKRGKGKKERKSYVTGKVIDGQHELYAQSIAVMLGVRTSIAKTNGLITADKHRKRWLSPADFLTAEKYEFRPGGSEDTPPHQLSHTFKFKDYAPVVFAYLRRLFGVNEFDFLLSVCGNANFIEFISNAKSGQFFFYSSDGKYMIKTMTNAESRFLRRILPDYFKHCCSNPNTMLTKFCGMYRVKLYHLRKNVKFVIMNSVFYTDKTLHEFYDLKGSIHGRDASPGDQVLKDNDLRARLPDGALAMPADVRDRVRRQLIRDCNFLQKQGIMDYSMLVGIHHIPPKLNDGDKAGGKNSSRRPSFMQQRKSVSHNGAGDGASVGGESTDSKGTYYDSGVATSASSGASVGSSVTGRESVRRSIHEMSDNLGPPMAMFDDILDDDDGSYLEGSEKRPPRPGSAPTSSIILNSDIEKKKSQTIEQIYWPFHRLHDIHGHRRMLPGPCFNCQCAPCQCKEDDKILKGYGIPNFVAPLSDRKDGGFMMDKTGLEFPMKFTSARHGEQLYEGKIFYMGVIDILQEYNSRKVVESRYRMLQGMDALEASCVAPRDYAARFVKFFDMYSQRFGKSAQGVLSTFKKSTRTSA